MFNIFDFSNLGGNQLGKAVSNQKLPTVVPFNPWVQPTYSPVNKSVLWAWEQQINTMNAPQGGIYNSLYNVGSNIADWATGFKTDVAKEERGGGMSNLQMIDIITEMKKDGLSKDEMATYLQAVDEKLKSEYRANQQKAREQSTGLRSVAWKTLELWAGNLQTLWQYGGNVLDFATLGKTGIGEDVKQMTEYNKEAFGDSNYFKAGTYLPDVALGVSPLGAWYMAWAKWAWQLALRSGVVGAWFGATQPILEKWNDATMWDIATWAAIGGTLWAAIPLTWAWIAKWTKWAAKYISKALPENLQVSGQFNRADLTNVSERLAKLTGKDVEVEDAARWLLDRWVKWDLKTQRQQIQAIIAKEEENASKILMSKVWDIGDTKEANALRKALSEKMQTLWDNVDGAFIPSAWNEDKAAIIQKIINNKSMTLSEMNEGRKLLWENLFTKQGTMKELASKEGWQNVWKDTSEFISKKAPWFREANKNTEVGIAVDKAMFKKETAEQTRAMLSYLWLWGGTGGAIGYGTSWGDLETTIKGAAIGFWVWQLSRILNTPKVKSTLAYYLNKLSPEARKAMQDLKKWVEIKPENIGKIVEEMKALPPPSWKPVSAKVINVKPINLPSKTPTGDITQKSVIKRPEGKATESSIVTTGKQVIRDKQISKITNELKQATANARFWGTWETKIVDNIKVMVKNWQVTREEAQNILFDIMDKMDTERWWNYMEWGKTISKYIDELAAAPTVTPKPIVPPKNVEKTVEPTKEIIKNKDTKAINRVDFEKATEKMWNNIIEFNWYKIARVNFRDKPWKIVDSNDFDKISERWYISKSFNTKNDLWKYIKQNEITPEVKVSAIPANWPITLWKQGKTIKRPRNITNWK